MCALRVITLVYRTLSTAIEYYNELIRIDKHVLHTPIEIQNRFNNYESLPNSDKFSNAETLPTTSTLQAVNLNKVFSR